MSQGLYTWSKTAASNGNSDASINFAEGQAPSSVNDSARALMARVAEYRDDVAGSITTAGTSTAYTVTTNEVFDTLAHMAGQQVAFVPHTTNGATVTLNVDGLGAKPLRSAPSTELPAGVLVQGSPYVATYNNSDGAFYLQGFYTLPYTVPIGAFLPYSSTTAPNSNFILPYGQNINRTTYATYFAMVGTTFGTGDGSTTFGVPDLRGRSIFGLDNMGGSAASRITVAGGNFNGTTLGATGGAENHTLTTAEMPVHNHGVTDPGHTHLIKGAQQGAGAGAVTELANLNNTNVDGTASSTTGITINNAGSGSAHTILPPAMVLPFILRVI